MMQERKSDWVLHAKRSVHSFKDTEAKAIMKTAVSSRAMFSIALFYGDEECSLLTVGP
jgi:hypothetical protein